MVLRNVAKTFSLEEQRQEINEIAVDLDAVNTTLTNWNAANWDTAYGWGDHAQAGYWVDNSTSRANWDTAYGWGDHGTAGYLVATSASYNNTNWDTAYGWGDHAQGGYLTAYQTDAQIKTSYEANADTNAFTDALLTKLNGIETSATADQTGAEIKTAYEGEADTNAFTDAEQTKLAGIADGAEVNLDPGGTFGGAGTTQDPAIGSIQFKNTGNTFGGDSGFLWNNTNNHLIVNGPSNSKDYTLSGGIFVQPGNGNSGLTLTSGSATDNTYINFAGGTASNAEQFAFAIGRDGTNDKGLVKISDVNVAEFTSDGIAFPSGKGIDFSANGNASGMTSELLNDYEHGTWTPTIVNLGDHTTTAASTWGKYTKIGNRVWITWRYSWTNRSTTNGSVPVYLDGIPFTSANDSNGSSVYIGGLEGVVCANQGRTHYGGYVLPNNTQIIFRVAGEDVSENSLQGSNATSLNSGYIYGGASYIV